MATLAASSLLAGSGASHSGLRASLHPLVLLTISDYLTRQRLRGSRQPLVGALLGQQKGTEITIEHAYDIKILPTQPGEEWTLDEQFFAERLQQYKDVHKAPPLDLVGWWTIGTAAGPGPETLEIHKHVLQNFNETSLVLVFHPEAAGNVALEQANGHAGAKLPLTIFETVYETRKGDADGDALMQDDGQNKVEAELDLKFAELPYEMVTGEAEMIAMDFVAKGSGNATAVEVKGESTQGKGKGKGKENGKTRDQGDSRSENPLNVQEEELISFLNSRANAIKMLQSRLTQLRSYLHRLPPSYLTDSSIPMDASEAQSSQSHQVLRSILTLTSRLPHLLPADIEAFLQEQSAERADVAVVTLLGSLGRSTIDAKELGRSFAIADSAKSVGRKTNKAHPGLSDHMSTLLGQSDQDWSRLDEM